MVGREHCHCGEGSSLLERERLGRIVSLRCDVPGRSEEPPITEYSRQPQRKS